MRTVVRAVARCFNTTSLWPSDMSKVQDDEVGDGTTSVTVLAAELLRVSVSSTVLCVYSDIYKYKKGLYGKALYNGSMT